MGFLESGDMSLKIKLFYAHLWRFSKTQSQFFSPHINLIDTYVRFVVQSALFVWSFKMTRVISASKARENIFNLIDETAATHQPIIITGKRGNAVMLSEDDYNAIQETFYLSANPKLKASIIEGLNTSLSECNDKIEW